MTTPTPASVLRAALEVLRRDGWQPGGGRPDDGPCCALQAILRSNSPGASIDEVFRLFANATGCEAVTTWNDAQPSFAPIEAAFLRAIALAEAEEPPHAD